MFAALWDLSVTHLVVRVKWLPSTRSDVDEYHPTKLMLKNMDTRQLAERLIKESHSVRYLFVELTGQETAYWEIYRQGCSGRNCGVYKLSLLDAIAAMDGEAF